jgi:hypothetical protein
LLVIYYYCELIIVVVLHVITMPLAWIYNIPKEEAEKLAMELGVPLQGTLEELGKRLKRKCKAFMTNLPPQSEDKSEVAMHTAVVSDTKVQGCDMHVHVSYAQLKLRRNVATDLVKNIPVFSDTEPESVYNFLIRAREVYDLNLVTDAEILALLDARTTGRLTQVISVQLSAFSKWGSDCSEILSTFLPPRIREGFLSKQVLDRFQSATEELSQLLCP